MKNNRFKSKKVAIIGAGIIGLYLGWKLSEKGEQVTIFEKKGIIGKEACSGLFSERILEFIPESRRLIQNEINSCLIHFPRKSINVKFSKTFFVMSHANLDMLTADLAQNAGAQIIKNCPIHSHIAVFGEFDRVIGCDGANSVVRKSLGLKEPSYRLGILGFIAERNIADYVEIWPVKKGFIWKIPRGEKIEYGRIAGVAGARKLFEEFLREKNIKVDNMKSTMIPQGLIIPKNSAVTLCGDAVGLTKPWSGGGVIWGLIAAEMLLNNFPDFLKYRQAMKKFFLLKLIC